MNILRKHVLPAVVIALAVVTAGPAIAQLSGDRDGTAKGQIAQAARTTMEVVGEDSLKLTQINSRAVSGATEVRVAVVTSTVTAITKLAVTVVKGRFRVREALLEFADGSVTEYQIDQRLGERDALTFSLDVHPSEISAVVLRGRVIGEDPVVRLLCDCDKGPRPLSTQTLVQIEDKRAGRLRLNQINSRAIGQRQADVSMSIEPDGRESVKTLAIVAHGGPVVVDDITLEYADGSARKFDYRRRLLPDKNVAVISLDVAPSSLHRILLRARSDADAETYVRLLCNCKLADDATRQARSGGRGHQDLASKRTIQVSQGRVGADPQLVQINSRSIEKRRVTAKMPVPAPDGATRLSSLVLASVKGDIRIGQLEVEFADGSRSAVDVDVELRDGQNTLQLNVAARIDEVAIISFEATRVGGAPVVRLLCACNAATNPGRRSNATGRRQFAEVGEVRPAVLANGRYNWSAAYSMQAMNYAYDLTGDERHMQTLVEWTERLLGDRDAKLDGEPVAWYDRSANISEPYVWAGFTGHAFAPVMEFAFKALSDDRLAERGHLGKTYRQHALGYLRDFERAIEYHAPELIEQGNFSFYKFARLVPLATGKSINGRILPVNMNSAMLMAIMYAAEVRDILGQRRRAAELKDHVQGYINYFNAQVKVEERCGESRCMLWKYSEYNDRAEDLGHSNVVVKFLIDAHDLGYRIKESDLQKLANTIDGIIDDNGRVTKNLLDGGNLPGDRSALYYVRLLARYSPALRSKFERAFTNTDITFRDGWPWEWATSVASPGGAN